MSPLSLPPTRASSPSEISLSPLSLSDSSDSDDAASSAGTDDSCTSACCIPDASSGFQPKDAPPVASVSPADWSSLIVIGAGPHALALAARLKEPRPAALYTDLEHARLSWLQRESRARARDASEKSRRRQSTVKGHWSARRLVPPKEVTLAAPTIQPSEIRVLDATGPDWLSRWDAFFSGLSISHLRSPMTFHPSPADVDALISYARRNGREAELEPIPGVVGRELSKYQRKKRRAGVSIGGAPLINERDRRDYQRPSSALFRDFVHHDLVGAYPVPDVEHTSVRAVSYGSVHVQGEGLRQGFLVESVRPDGSTERRAAQAVAMAIGPSSVPSVPSWLLSATRSQPEERHERTEGLWRREAICGPGWCHSSAFAVPGCRPMEGPLGDRIRQGLKTRVCVVGGGLTSAQIVDSLLTQGVSSVVLLVRSQIKTKHFDFDLEWVSKYNNLRKMQFFQEEDRAERSEQVRRSRNGGSVNPTFARILKHHGKSGRLEVRCWTEVEEARYDAECGKWGLSTVTKPPSGRGHPGATLDPEPVRTQLSDIDFIVASTGSRLDFAGVDFLDPLRRAGHLPATVDGLPILTPDLQLTPTLPFFVLGAYAMLELGPDALNLSGTRGGAERVAHRLGELGIFDRYPTGEDAASRRMQAKRARSGGEGNFFEGLPCEVEA